MPVFLSLSEIVLIYEDQIKRYGGISGIRDFSLLNSALCMPSIMFENRYLHETIPEMAAAYAYHLCKNHAFIDGNKRLALAASLVFLDLNGYDFNCGNDEIYDIIMSVASGFMNKHELTQKYCEFCIKGIL